MIMRAARWALPPMLVAAALAALPGSAGADGEPTLADVRDATVRFHSLAQADRAGYNLDPLPCFPNMGDHLINGTLLGDGGELHAEHPEALVYEVTDQGNWKLVAVEYVVLFTDVPDTPENRANPPSVLGQDLTPSTELGLWKLHAWIFESNPTSVFADFNPETAGCPQA